MKLSIVIPAYNVEQYIGNCLDSIFSQQIETDRLEVIVVNDGSKDGTEGIIKQYAVKHPNLIYISQENQGQSVSRNNGLKRATGDIIWYIDSDDTANEGSINKIFHYFEKYPEADLLIFDWRHVYTDRNKEIYCHGFSQKRLKFRNNLYEKKLDREKANARLIGFVPWLVLCKRKYLLEHQLYLVPGLLNEDEEVRMRYFFFAKEVRYIPFAHYVYSANREGSLTTINKGKSMKVVESCMKTVDLWRDFYLKNAKSKADKKFVMGFLCNMYGRLLRRKNEKRDSDQYKTYLTHHKEWEKGFKDAFWKSFSIKSLSPIPLARALSTLYFPQYYYMLHFSYIKRLLHL